MSAVQQELERERKQLGIGQMLSFTPLEGIVVTGARDHGDRVWVKIPTLNPHIKVGPARWHARDAIQRPQKGDGCLVLFDDNQVPWVTVWWPLNLDVVAAARRALDQKSHYHYDGIRPMPNSLWIAAPVNIDCSSFATLCFKAAHCLDPNRSDYDGQGFTGTLFANGTPTTTPRPGDLAFYGVDADDPTAPDHVTVCIGNDNCISMGEEGDPTLKPVDYRTDAIPGGGAAPYFMTYVLA